MCPSSLASVTQYSPSSQSETPVSFKKQFLLASAGSHNQKGRKPKTLIRRPDQVSTAPPKISVLSHHLGCFHQKPIH